MGTIRPRRLTIKNFRSFLNETTFELPERGLVLVRGWNEDAHDTSGSGKSSFLEALAFANDISEFPATEHQSWFTEEPFEVTYQFDEEYVTEGGTGTTGGLRKLGAKTSLSYDKSPLLKSAKSIKEKMASIMGLSPDMLKALVYRPQKKPGLFLTMTDGQKKEFLTNLLGLGQFEVEAEKSQKRVTALTQEVEKREALLTQAASYVGTEPKGFVAQDVDESGLKSLREKLKMGEEALPGLGRRRAAIEAEFDELSRAYDEASEKRMAPVMAERDRYAAESRSLVVAPEILAQEKKLGERVTIIDQRISEAKAEWAETDKRFAETIKGFRAGAARAREHAAPKGEYEAQLADVQKQIALIENATCPTCERLWQTGQKKLSELTVEAAELDQAIHECVRYEDEAKGLGVSAESWEYEYGQWKQKPQVPQELLDMREKLVASLGSISQQKRASLNEAGAERRLKLAEYERKLTDIAAIYRQEMDDLRARINPTLARLDIDMEAVKGVVNGLREQVKAEERRLNDIREANCRGLDQYVEAREAWERSVDAVKRAENALAEAQAELALEKDFLLAVGKDGFLGLIFDDVLNAIADETNAILANVPTVAHVTLQFVSERETQEGKLRKEIKPVLSANGRDVSLRSLSGGMQTAVELAVDIAVGNVVMQRTGVFPGWLVLDEAFEGLGVNAKKACLDILKRAAENRLIIVVDHATEIREAFDTVFNITLRDGVSTLS